MNDLSVSLTVCRMDYKGSQAWRVRAIRRLGDQYWRLVQEAGVEGDGCITGGEPVRWTDRLDVGAEEPQDSREPCRVL